MFAEGQELGKQPNNGKDRNQGRVEGLRSRDFWSCVNNVETVCSENQVMLLKGELEIGPDGLRNRGRG